MPGCLFHALSMCLCSPYPPLLSKNSAEDTPSNPALWRPAVPWQDLSCFGLSIWLARTPPLLDTSFHISSSSPTAANQASQRQHISVFINLCQRQVAWKNSTGVTEDCHFMTASYLPGPGTKHRNATWRKVSLNLKDIACSNSAALLISGTSLMC